MSEATKIAYYKESSIPSSIEDMKRLVKNKMDKDISFEIDWSTFENTGLESYRKLDDWVQLCPKLFTETNSVIDKFGPKAKAAAETWKKVRLVFNAGMGPRDFKVSLVRGTLTLELNFSNSEAQSSNVRDALGEQLVKG